MLFLSRPALAVVILEACVAVSPGLTAAKPAPVAVWSYLDFLGEGGERAAFFRFAAARHVAVLYLGAGDLLPRFQDPLADFIEEARTRGIAVQLVLGRDDGFLPSRREETLEEIKAVRDFAQALEKEGRATPAGLQLDIEPHTLPQWGQDWVLLAGQYLEFLEAAKAELGGALPLAVDIPVWWSRREVKRGALCQPLSAWVMDIVDQVVLMDYRDTTTRILASAREDLRLAKKKGRKVVLGLNAHCEGDPEAARTTFCGKGGAALERAMAQVEKRLGGAPGYGGLAVFAYEDWRDLPAKPGR